MYCIEWLKNLFSGRENQIKYIRRKGKINFFLFLQNKICLMSRENYDMRGRTGNREIVEKAKEFSALYCMCRCQRKCVQYEKVTKGEKLENACKLIL